MKEEEQIQQLERTRQELAVRLVELLKEQGLHIVTAESCTGGMVASSLVDIPGASLVFEEGYITYSDKVKNKVLHVSRETLRRDTAVSAAAAREMAAGAAERAGAELSVAVTGYAGPGAAEDGTPAGTVYISTWHQGIAKAEGFAFAGDRQTVREQAAVNALRLAAERLKDSE